MGLSIVAVTINCRNPRSLAEWWAETLDEGEITQDLGEYVFVHAGRVELGFQGVAAAAQERIRLHLDLEADDPDAEVRRLVDRGAVVVEQHELAPLGMAWTVLRDPEANDFCVSARGTTLPASAPQT
jgi:predicted enzyme related to lactoylglutathione lyase